MAGRRPPPWLAAALVSFRHLIRALREDGRRVVVPDLRGFGWSGTPGSGYTTAQFTKDLFTLLDVLGLERVDLVGHDWGCFVGYRATLEEPERFRRYVAMSAPGPHARYKLRTIATLWRYWYQQPLALPVIGPRTVRAMYSPRSLVGRWIGLHRTSKDVVAAYMLQFDDPAALTPVSRCTETRCCTRSRRRFSLSTATRVCAPRRCTSMARRTAPPAPRSSARWPSARTIGASRCSTT